MKPIAIKGEANIYQISGIQDQILKAWKGDTALTLDLSKAEDVDSSFIQLLLSCKRSAQANSQQFEILKVPEHVQSMLDALYANDCFSEEVVEEGSGTKTEGSEKSLPEEIE